MTMLYCVANRFEITRIKKLISEIDPESFVAVNEVSEVLGNRIKFSLNTAVKPKQLRKRAEEENVSSAVSTEEKPSDKTQDKFPETVTEDSVESEKAKDDDTSKTQEKE